MERIINLLLEHNRRIALAASLLIVMLLGVSIANTVLFILDEVAPSTITAYANNGTKRPDPAGPKLSTMELFGNERLSSAIDAPATKLNLVLHGVFIADDPNLSTAIIAPKNQKGDVYKVGNRLPGGSTLSAVHGDHVLIQRGTRVEKLGFPANVRSQPFIPVPSTTPAPEPPPSNQNPLPTGSAQEAWQTYRQRLERDPTNTLASFGLSAVSNNKPQGYLLSPESTQPLLQQAGLQPGDIVLSVNGTPLGNINKDSAMVQQVIDSGQARVEVQRGDRRFFLTLPIPN